MPLHSALTGTELHENKGVAGAADNTVATADTGATVWQKVNTDMLDTSSIFDTNKQALQAILADVSTAEAVFIPIPFDCTVENIYITYENAITAANAVLTFSDNSNTSMGTSTYDYTTSSAGFTTSMAPVTNNSFTAGQKMKLATDGASTGAGRVWITIELLVTG